MLTTAGPYCWTRPLKSGSAAALTVAGAPVVAAVAGCRPTRSATPAPTANAAASAIAIALRLKVFACIVCSLMIDRDRVGPTCSGRYGRRLKRDLRAADPGLGRSRARRKAHAHAEPGAVQA